LRGEREGGGRERWIQKEEQRERKRERAEKGWRVRAIFKKQGERVKD
jgi:hypothetical protein